jgi:hypothetical protein
VEKRATRKWKDAREVSKLLGHNGECFTEPELKSPAQVEKVLGKKNFAIALAEHVDKQSSGYTLVSESDPRPPAQVAQLEDFGVIGGNAEAEQ